MSPVDVSVLERMKEVETAVKVLDPEVRGEAFEMFRSYILGSSAETSDQGGGSGVQLEKRTAEPAKVRPTDPPSAPAPTEFGEFIDRFESDTAADNAMALAAFLYGEYGIEPFSIQEIEDLAAKAGVTVPSRIDMTIRQKNWNKKKAFRRTSKGHFRPTVDGEAFLKQTFGVKKGIKKRQSSES
jgi:hypothetical protein